MSTREYAEKIIEAAADDEERARLAATRSLCNSASAFLHLARRHGLAKKACAEVAGTILREALKLGKHWVKNKLARTILATIKSLKAAAERLLQKQERENMRERVKSAAATIIANAGATSQKTMTDAAAFTRRLREQIQLQLFDELAVA